MSQTVPRIVVVGSLNADLVMRVPRLPVGGETLSGRSFQTFPGGKGGNQACAAARLGADVRLLAQVGNDAHGSWLRDSLRLAGVDVRGVVCDEATASGVAFILIDDEGHNQIVVVSGANGTFTPQRLDLSLMEGARALLFQLETPLETTRLAVGVARGAHALVMLDPAPARPVPDDLLGELDYITPNETELALIAGQAPEPVVAESEALDLASRLLDRGARRVVVKRAERGAMLVSRDGFVSCPAFLVRAVDSTAAGDTFNAAFAYALCDGSTEVEALRYACAAAAVSVTRPGAQPSVPTAEEVRAFLEGHACGA